MKEILKVDKLLHFIAGTYIFLVFSILLPDIIGLLTVAIFGGAKELIWDKKLGRGTPDWKDFASTFLGGLIAYLLIRLR